MRYDLTWLVATGALLVSGSAATAQGLQREIDRADDGVLTFQYEVREDVEICENGVRTGDSHYSEGRFRGRDRDCVRGYGELRLEIRGGEIRDLELQPPGTGRADQDLGEQGPEEVADFLLGLARTGNRGVAKNAIFPATLGRGVTTWPRLMGIARDRRRPDDVRKQAVFWIGQAAADAATEGLGTIAFDETEDDEVRDAAVFALSQRPAHESMPLLMELAETAEQARVRRSALFWLAQSNDDEVLDFFERVLRGG